MVVMKKEYEALRSQFEIQETQSLRLIPADVIGFLGNSTHPSALIINLGEHAGIKNGEAVIFNNNLIGRIEKSFANYSKVILLENPAFSTLGFTSENNSEGIIKGENDFILLDNVS